VNNQDYSWFMQNVKTKIDKILKLIKGNGVVFPRVCIFNSGYNLNTSIEVLKMLREKYPEMEFWSPIEGYRECLGFERVNEFAMLTNNNKVKKVEK